MAEYQALPVSQDVAEIPGSEDVPEGGGGQKPGGPVVVVIVADGAQWVGDLSKQTLCDKLEYFIMRKSSERPCLSSREDSSRGNILILLID